MNEEEQQKPLVNGHVGENVTTEVTSNHSDTKVVTKTTTVTETQVITEISSGKNSEKITLVNGSNSSHSLSSPDENKEIVKKVEETKANNVEEKIPIESPPVSENGSVQEIPAESIKSPSKVKKSKSFKKTLMKKFKKDDK